MLILHLKELIVAHFNALAGMEMEMGITDMSNCHMTEKMLEMPFSLGQQFVCTVSE